MTIRSRLGAGEKVQHIRTCCTVLFSCPQLTGIAVSFLVYLPVPIYVRTEGSLAICVSNVNT
jgi:hypothetical protein